MNEVEEFDECSSIYQGIVSNPHLLEKIILSLYVFIFIIGLLGNLMTIIIIPCNSDLRTRTNFYLLNLAFSDLLMLTTTLPMETLEIYHRQWPFSNFLCKIRNISAELFTCSSILTILAFTCERYFSIVRPNHRHRSNHFGRTEIVICAIWLISSVFSIFLGCSYEIERISDSNHPTVNCVICVPKSSLAKIFPWMIIISSIVCFYLPMLIIGSIYLFIGRALRRLNHYHQEPINQRESQQSCIETEQRLSYHSSYNWLKMRSRFQARQVVIKTLS